MKITYSVLALALFFACASTKDGANYYFKQEVIEQEGQKTVKTQEIEIQEYETAEQFGNAQLNSHMNENTQKNVMLNTEKYTIKPTKEKYHGGAVIYNYVDDYIYPVYVGILNLTDFQLDPGEKIISSPAAGDTYTFMIDYGKSYYKGKERAHIYIKAIEEYKETILHVNTDKRIYKLKLMSYKSTFMPTVRFDYPLSNNDAKLASNKDTFNGIKIFGSLSDLNFGYQILPSSIDVPTWVPTMVFTDGVKTYINFASARRVSYAPALFLVENKKRIASNYRVIGNYYIVDKVIEEAHLILDVKNKKERVLIKKVN